MVARALAKAGKPDRAARLVADAEAVARTITDEDERAGAFVALTIAAAQAGDFDRAEALARNLNLQWYRALALAALARGAARTGDVDRAVRLVADAEAVARTITHPHDQTEAFTALTIAAALAGDLDHGEALALLLPKTSSMLVGADVRVGADVVRDGGRRGARATGNAVAW